MNEASLSTTIAHEARRRRIVEAARSMAAVEGWETVTVRRLAARLECSAPALYQYFPDKESIVAVVAAEGAALRAAALAAVATAETGPLKRIRALAETWWNFAQDHRELAAVMPGIDAASREILAEAAGDLVRRKSVSAPPDDLADRLGALIHGFVALTLAGCFMGGPERAREQMMQAVEDWLKGLLRR